MAKFLLVIALVIVVYLLVRGFRRVENQQQPTPPQSPPPRNPATGEEIRTKASRPSKKVAFRVAKALKDTI